MTDTLINPTKKLKVVVFVPESHANIVREAMGKAGAGQLGKYMYCSFSTNGVGRFLPTDGASPAIGTVGKHEQVAEERIEMTCDREVLKDVISAIHQTHPYEEIAMDVYELVEI